MNSETTPALSSFGILTDDERQPCEIWTRVMGYHRPMSSFNTGKKGEFHERRYFVENSSGATVQPCFLEHDGV